jgi:hypothetical protein
MSVVVIIDVIRKWKVKNCVHAAFFKYIIGGGGGQHILKSKCFWG